MIIELEKYQTQHDYASFCTPIGRTTFCGMRRFRDTICIPDSLEQEQLMPKPVVPWFPVPPEHTVLLSGSPVTSQQDANGKKFAK